MHLKMLFLLLLFIAKNIFHVSTDMRFADYTGFHVKGKMMVQQAPCMVANCYGLPTVTGCLRFLAFLRTTDQVPFWSVTMDLILLVVSWHNHPSQLTSAIFQERGTIKMVGWMNFTTFLSLSKADFVDVRTACTCSIKKVLLMTHLYISPYNHLALDPCVWGSGLHVPGGHVRVRKHRPTLFGYQGVQMSPQREHCFQMRQCWLLEYNHV